MSKIIDSFFATKHQRAGAPFPYDLSALNSRAIVKKPVFPISTYRRGMRVCLQSSTSLLQNCIRFQYRAGPKPAFIARQGRERFRSLQIKLAIIIALSGLYSSAFALEPKWPAGPYPYNVVDQDVRTVLQEFGRNLNFRINVSDRVKGRIRGKIPNVSSRGFLDYISKNYGLEWFYDGFTLHVSSADENSTRVFDLGSNTLPKLKEKLKKACFYDERFALRDGGSGHSVVASGPPYYLAFIDNVLTGAPLPDVKAANTPIPSSVKTTIYRGGNVSEIKFEGGVATASAAATTTPAEARKP